jgi:hypothetical protein
MRQYRALAREYRGRSMKLQPGTYACPDHKSNLTELVEEALDVDVPPVAFGRGFLAARAPAERPFEVIVTCPGGGTPHTLKCTGLFTRE